MPDVVNCTGPAAEREDLAAETEGDRLVDMAIDLSATAAEIADQIAITGGACTPSLEHARELLATLNAELGDGTDPNGFLFAQDRAWANKRAKGFNTTNVPLEFCLLMRELTEAFTACYEGRDGDVGGELADMGIFLFALAQMHGLDLGAEIFRKLAVNEAAGH